MIAPDTPPLPSPDPKELRFEDIELFLQIYKRARDLPLTGRTAYAKLFGTETGKSADKPDGTAAMAGSNDVPGAYTSIVSQLQRVAAFALRLLVYPETPTTNHKPRLELLFARQVMGDGGLRPTPVAEELYKEWKLLQDVYKDCGKRTLERLQKRTPAKVVRLGAGPNFATRVLPAILSNWKQVFVGKDGRAAFDLQVEVGNTEDLLPRLGTGFLDAVIGYGLHNAAGVMQTGLTGFRVGFSSFGFDSKMVLLAHPLVSIFYKKNRGAKSGRDINQGYGDKLHAMRKKRPSIENVDWNEKELPPRYNDLEEVDLNAIDFQRTGLELIVTRSWDNAPGIAAFTDNPENKGIRVGYVNDFEAAVGRVKLQIGLAILPEIFCRRQMTTAFRLEPKGQFTRYIGIYYSPDFPFNEETYRILTFIRSYINDFIHSIRNGVSPNFQDESYLRWCQKVFRVPENWEELVSGDYPMRLTHPKKGDKAGKKSHGS